MSTSTDALFQITKLDENSTALLRVNLEPYCSAVVDREYSEEPFEKIRSILMRKLSGVIGDCYLDDMLEVALKDESKENISAIKQSPAISSLSRNFIELIKNSVDAVIERRLNGQSAVAILNFKLDIALSADRNSIKVKLSDNGGGFPREFLEKYTPSFVREHDHSLDVGGSKKAKTNDIYFGGRGRGLPLLMTKVIKGASVISKGMLQQDEIVSKEDHSQVVFSNDSASGGATIEITTPIAPRKPFVAAVEEDIPLSKPFGSLMQRRLAALQKKSGVAATKAPALSIESAATLDSLSSTPSTFLSSISVSPESSKSSSSPRIASSAYGFFAPIKTPASRCEDELTPESPKRP